MRKNARIGERGGFKSEENDAYISAVSDAAHAVALETSKLMDLDSSRHKYTEIWEGAKLPMHRNGSGEDYFSARAEWLDYRIGHRIRNVPLLIGWENRVLCAEMGVPKQALGTKEEWLNQEILGIWMPHGDPTRGEAEEASGSGGETQEHAVITMGMAIKTYRNRHVAHDDPTSRKVKGRNWLTDTVGNYMRRGPTIIRQYMAMLQIDAGLKIQREAQKICAKTGFTEEIRKNTLEFEAAPLNVSRNSKRVDPERWMKLMPWSVCYGRADGQEKGDQELRKIQKEYREWLTRRRLPTRTKHGLIPRLSRGWLEIEVPEGKVRLRGEKIMGLARISHQ